MLVSHRNMVSVYDMRSDNIDGNWLDTILLDHNCHVRKMFIKKRNKFDRDADQASAGKLVDRETLSIFRKYEIACILGIKTIKYLQMSPLGDILSTQKKQAPGRIIKFTNDKLYGNGILLLCDKAL